MSVKSNFDTLDLAKRNPEAFAALPEPYQADDCLQFWFDINSNLCCEPKEDQEFALGYFLLVFDGKEWVQVKEPTEEQYRMFSGS